MNLDIITPHSHTLTFYLPCLYAALVLTPHTQTHTLQFLESYKSVTLDSMATAFDVGLPFLDSEISDFICAGRISAKIDKV